MYRPPKMQKWINDQIRRRASIPQDPYESLQPLYSIIYSRQSTNPYWEYRRANAAAHIPAAMPIQFKLDDIAGFLDQAADYEQAKELDFLSKFYKGDSKATGNETITEKFNLLFQGRELFEKYE